MPLPSHSDSPLSERELVLTRDTDVPAAALYAGWTQPQLLVQWFTPEPWRTVSAEVDLRPGGVFRTVMRSPEGQDFPNVGVFLELVPDARLVFTNAFGADWEPNPDLFFTAIVTFEPQPDGRTRYTACVRHWTKDACAQHAAMGFHDGWGKAFDQLVALVRSSLLP